MQSVVYVSIITSIPIVERVIDHDCLYREECQEFEGGQAAKISTY
jgi:hypothetical protein